MIPARGHMVERPTDLADKVVIVTGAGHGIGRAVAERFAIAGARVVVNDVDQARADEVARALPGEAVGVRADVAKSSDVSALFDATLERFGTVDVSSTTPATSTPRATSSRGTRRGGIRCLA